TGTAGQVAINADNKTVTYTPATGFAGTDTFHYTISDGQGGTASAAVTVTVNASDLQVTGPTVPSGLLLGSPVQVPLQWSVTNAGKAVPSTSQWNDQVILSTDQTLGNADDSVVGQLTHNGALAPGGTYTSGPQSVTLPLNLTGTFYLFVV